MTEGSEQSFEEWLATAPPSVQSLAREFPITTEYFNPPVGMLWVVGYTEADELILSSVNPLVDHNGWRDPERQLIVPADIFRDSTPSTLRACDE